MLGQPVDLGLGCRGLSRRVADPATRQRAADEYDRKADRWADRVRTAHEIIEQGLAALTQPLL